MGIDDLDPARKLSKSQIEKGIWVLNDLKKGNLSPLDDNQIEFLNFFKIHPELIKEITKESNYHLNSQTYFPVRTPQIKDNFNFPSNQMKYDEDNQGIILLPLKKFQLKHEENPATNQKFDFILN
jgi:hypothetical protein